MPDSRNPRRRSRNNGKGRDSASPRPREDRDNAPEAAPEDALERTTVFARPPLQRSDDGGDDTAQDTADTGRFAAPPTARAQRPDDTGRFRAVTGSTDQDAAEHTQVFGRAPATETGEPDDTSVTGRLRRPASGEDLLERTRVYRRPPLQGRDAPEAPDEPPDGTALYRALPAEDDWHVRTAAFADGAAGPGRPAAAGEQEAVRENRRLQTALDETRSALESALETLADRDLVIARHELTHREQRQQLDAAGTRQRELEQQLQRAVDDGAALRRRIDELARQDAAAELAELQRRHARQAEALEDLRHYVDARREHWRNQADALAAERTRTAELLRELDQRRVDRARLTDELDRALEELDRLHRAGPGARTPRAGRTLEVSLPDGSVRAYPLDRPVITIGRTGNNDVQVPAQYISRTHARVVCDGDACRIEDTNSRNGVRVNGRRVTSRVLRDGDRLMLGETPMTYRERRR